MTQKKQRVAILISGRGSNMEALIEAASESDYPAEIVGVISNEETAAGLAIAQQSNVKIRIIDHRNFGTRAEFEDRVHAQLMDWHIDRVCLAGFMRIISKNLIDKWPDKIINIHPSTLPDYPGLNVHERVFKDRKQYSGCTVHYVREKVDFGPGIVQAKVAVADCRSPQEIAERVLALEHLIYPLAVLLFCGGMIEVVDEKVFFKGQRHRSLDSLDGAFNPLIIIDFRYEEQIIKKNTASRVQMKAELANQLTANVQMAHL